MTWWRLYTTILSPLRFFRNLSFSYYQLFKIILTDDYFLSRLFSSINLSDLLCSFLSFPANFIRKIRNSSSNPIFSKTMDPNSGSPFEILRGKKDAEIWEEGSRKVGLEKRVKISEKSIKSKSALDDTIRGVHIFQATTILTIFPITRLFTSQYPFPTS